MGISGISIWQLLIILVIILLLFGTKRLSNIGSEYMLAAKVVDPNTQQAVWSRTLRARGKEQVLTALDDLAGEVRQELGESLTRISAQRLPLAKATTFTLEALRLYSQAMQSPGKDAVPLLRRAVELDPQFALAHSALGLQYYIAMDRVNGEAHFAKAISLLDRLTEREALWIRALVEDDFDGILLRAEATLAKLADELGQVSADPDGTTAQRSAHMLAGLAGNFGCAAVMTTARAIEAAYRAGDGQHAAQMLGELKRLMPPTLDALRRARLKPPP